MLYTLQAVNIIAVVLMLFMLAVSIRQQPSRSQIAFILYNVFTIIFVVGIHLELIHSDTVGEALSGLCIQYVGQAGFLIAFLWFTSQFASFKVPGWVYGVQVVVEGATLIGVFTAEHHTYFYSSMTILTDGMYNRIKVTGGVLWHLHFLHFFAVLLTILILCAVRYRKSTPIQKKRILYIAAGISVLMLVLALKIAGLFGSYNPVVIAVFITMFCMMMAIVRYGYFGSLHAAVDNAFNHGDEGLIILDQENTIIFINHRIGRLFPDIREGDNISSSKEIMEILQRSDHMLDKGGAVYELRIEDIIENGERNGYMLWFIDQTEYLKVMQQLRDANEAKTQFLMKVSHELRTPMNTMLGMNEMIIRETNEAQIRSFAKDVADAGQNMISLIEEVLDVSRIESGNLELKKRPYQIEDILQKAEAMMRPQAEKKGLSFQVQIEERLMDEKRFLYGDDVHLLQIITNLLSNAIKYTDEGYVILKAEVKVKEEQKVLCLSVSDTGIGIPKAEQEWIFENFERGSNARKTEKDGMGIGLAIVKQLVEAIEGTLVVKSELGIGSTFLVTVPWVENIEHNQTAYESEIQGRQRKIFREIDAETTAGSMSVPDFSTKTILAVDDNKHNLVVLKHLLKRTQVTVETATDGIRAVEACSKKTYDLILLDHMMPFPDGIETLHRIRADKAGKNHYTTAIVLTANATKGSEEMYLKEGFDGYVAKPIQPDQLENILLQYMGMARGRNTFDGNTAQSFQEQMHLLEKNGIHSQDGLQYADGDMKFYQDLLTMFAGEKESKAQKLDKALPNLLDHANETLWNTFVSQVHGLKGEARGIGAAYLGELFYQLEIAGKQRDKKKIKEIYSVAMEEWQRIAEIIKETAATW